ncbi:hypothetical protein PRIPAC_95242 [Pristionchus pacificus]|uniref:Nuclear receptor domain-containing protein n=1 Tax=Pristionchus pacificus TaxID=54126 RepID=A0A8R1V6B4_PRIPA|nr:hypothetical protein PRIPAC_95242 [Pristionchus pacificus]
MPVKCLVCGKPTSVTHMGMDACRACTVFYRRNRAKRLLCVKGYKGCMNDPKHTFACRKCRLERFKAILKAGNDEDKTIALSMFRRIAELNLRGIDVDIAEPYDEKLEIIPSTYQLMNEGKKIQIAGLFKYIPTMFPEFRVLPNADKWLLIRNYYRSFHYYLLCCIFSGCSFAITTVVSTAWTLLCECSAKESFFFGSYTTVVSKESIWNFFVDCPDPTNADAATKTMFGTFHNIVDPMRNQIRQVDPSEDEFMALMGLAFWSFENIDPSEELLALAERYRASIISELSSLYRSSMGKQRGTSRIGVLLCSLQEFKRAEMILQADYDVFHMLGTFDDDTVTYRLGIR